MRGGMVFSLGLRRNSFRKKLPIFWNSRLKKPFFGCGSSSAGGAVKSRGS